jgi:hypothetical protein
MEQKWLMHPLVEGGYDRSIIIYEMNTIIKCEFQIENKIVK